MSKDLTNSSVEKAEKAKMACLRATHRQKSVLKKSKQKTRKRIKNVL